MHLGIGYKANNRSYSRGVIFCPGSVAMQFLQEMHPEWQQGALMNGCRPVNTSKNETI